jgi:seryl-tRNA synthetase
LTYESFYPKAAPAAFLFFSSCFFCSILNTIDSIYYFSTVYLSTSMIDLELLRSNPEDLLERIAKKDPLFDGEKLRVLDQAVRQLTNYVEQLRHEKNQLAEQGKQGTITSQLREQSRILSQTLKEKEHELQELTCIFRDLYLRCPNLLLDDVPAGTKQDNKVVKIVGTKPEFKFTPKNHVELGLRNGWFDFEAAARMTASNFVMYKNKGVEVVYTLMLYMLQNNMRHGYSPVLPPYLVNCKALEGASNFPRFEDQVYKLPEDKLYLTPTAEVNLTALYREQVLAYDQLPVRMTAWTSCFRREAGSYGAHERGLIRIHQFEKAELYTLCLAQQAEHEQQRMLACAETILQALGLHYRVCLLAAQDCSFASAKTYDIEVWMPGHNAGEYKEVSSISNCTDFQARRSAIRYKNPQTGKNNLVYTLNGSSLALPRLMVALMETYQQPDGSIALPESINSFLGFR